MACEFKNVSVDKYRLGPISFCHHTYLLRVAILREDDGTFSAIGLNLPGVGSCGATEYEATENVREAAAGVIESYLADGVEISWLDKPYVVPAGARQKLIIVRCK